MISEGRGMHADSIAISAATPKYPVLEITPMMIFASTAIIFSVIRRVYSLDGVTHKFGLLIQWRCSRWRSCSSVGCPIQPTDHSFDAVSHAIGNAFAGL